MLGLTSVENKDGTRRIKLRVLSTEYTQTHIAFINAYDETTIDLQCVRIIALSHSEAESFLKTYNSVKSTSSQHSLSWLCRNSEMVSSTTITSFQQ